ncbi:hypothetical protein HDF19_02780 [Mucilaginibacter sp. E4BP6]|uniref:hypothetical protein n=1 Tax=Mucilaginibacter sp. E4BP6 TaxID=2723089 RepID=UPI0015C95532|nr:hypothetical protein [Mucilaginibacter sp. E4BP6]NYE64385.1 hypothetical protein [Mucilaginibacter sp. E4BP6]
MAHTFHIPVLGLGYSIDTPLKVARYGISSVVSIVDDELIERMREYHSRKNNIDFKPINKSVDDYRAKRITGYLNLIDELVYNQFTKLKNEPFEIGSEICRYFELLPEDSQLGQGYDLMMEYPENVRKSIFQTILREKMTAGVIDVNIMAKVDKLNYAADGSSTGEENTDALAAFRGFANSNLQSSVILSAGMNPRLYSYIETFTDFYPDKAGDLKKKIVLKVSDFRSAFIQAKFLAKKGLWVSEFRVESGLNCGGHAFATEGYLLGPILEEFKTRREEMYNELFGPYQLALLTKGISIEKKPSQRISAQGGIGTAEENKFFLDHYNLDATGWGSPFLLVPEATNVDEATLKQLTGAEEDDFYISDASPLGILFNNFKSSSINTQRIERMAKGRPGSPCTKKYLCTNTEFTDVPICTASREYQNLKIKQLKAQQLPEDEYKAKFDSATEKICLCEGLCSAVYLKLDIIKPKENKAVSICPGPNLAYFKRTYSLEEMVKHIYGAVDLLDKVNRPHIFIKELNLYIDYLKTDMQKHLKDLSDKKRKSLNNFKTQLQQGINYYKELVNELPNQTPDFLNKWFSELMQSENILNHIAI